MMRAQSEHYAYPCIYLFHFLGLFMQENNIYQRVVDAGKFGSTSFLDIGCCSKYFAIDRGSVTQGPTQWAPM